jgi:hypothetical protein
MKRPRNVITGVTASLLLAGLLPPGPVLGQAPATPPAEEKRSVKVSPEVLAAAEEIHAWLRGTTADQPKTRGDAAKQFTAMQPIVIDQALAKLRNEGKINRAGDGTAASPYRYYEKTTTNG